MGKEQPRAHPIEKASQDFLRRWILDFKQVETFIIPPLTLSYGSRKLVKIFEHGYDIIEREKVKASSLDVMGRMVAFSLSKYQITLKYLVVMGM